MDENQVFINPSDQLQPPNKKLLLKRGDSSALDASYPIYYFSSLGTEERKSLSREEYEEYLEKEAYSRNLIHKKIKKIAKCSSLSYKEIIDKLSRNKSERTLLLNQKLPDHLPPQTKLGINGIKKTTWDFVLESVAKKYSSFVSRIKNNKKQFGRVKRQLELNPLYLKMKELAYYDDSFFPLFYDSKKDYEHSKALARKVSDMVMSKWLYINSVLQAFKEIESREKQIEESEKKLLKVLKQSTDILSKPAEESMSFSETWTSKDETYSSDSDFKTASFFYPLGKLPDYLNFSSDDSDLENSTPTNSFKNSNINNNNDNTIFNNNNINISKQNPDFPVSFSPNLSETPEINDEPDFNLNESSLLKVSTEIPTVFQDQFNNRPSLLRNTLRYYQNEGVQWLIKQHNSHRNSILADEMGLGKTIQTIALLDYLALNQGNWGPHLIVVPASVLLNWEQEFKKWLPGFKVLTIYGSAKQRKKKRTGWSRINSFHVCITSYQIILQDIQVFKRRPWSYLILDEAQNIKNFQSKRWQTLMQIKSEYRLLLTGTPLQNSLSELWSLLFFLLPHSGQDDSPTFADLEEFQTWFSKPLDSIMDLSLDLNFASKDQVFIPGLSDIQKKNRSAGSESATAIRKLHTVLRPYILRRLKSAVETQMPTKTEYVVYCNMSTRQKYLYHDFISRSKTRETLQKGSYLDVMSCLTQLRKVCNHPDLFEPRQILTSWSPPNVFLSGPINQSNLGIVLKLLKSPRKGLGFDLYPSKPENGSVPFASITTKSLKFSIHASNSTRRLDISHLLVRQSIYLSSIIYVGFNDFSKTGNFDKNSTDIDSSWSSQVLNAQQQDSCRMHSIANLNYSRTNNFIHPLCSDELHNAVLISLKGSSQIGNNTGYGSKSNLESHLFPLCLKELYLSYASRLLKYDRLITNFTFLVPKVTTTLTTLNPCFNSLQNNHFEVPELLQSYSKRLQISFPDKMMLQFDCGKLQRLYELLTTLIYKNGDRVLIFTQMTRMLDILEKFLAIHNFRYLRLDGSTKIEHRLALTEQFNNNPRYHCFLSSTRAGGLGINLTGANCVIFFDSDWNPSMDAQCQDRCHRIGQTRDVKIYRLITLNSIEENIWKKAVQKRVLDQVVIQEGNFDGESANKQNLVFNWKDVAKKTLHESSTLKESEPHFDSSSDSTTNPDNKISVSSDDIDDEKALQTALKEINTANDFDFEDGQSENPMDNGKTNTPEAPKTTTEASETSFEEKPDISINLGIDINGEQPKILRKNAKLSNYTNRQEIGHIDDYIVRFINRAAK
ncbi:hypothetical protein BB560_005311 [Smittium megazygosporum]|uniref:Helicase SWR1 n=1 Tax=Smittium megazygosporum TaxID=133381 RepID=A0A2T9Z6Y5_9FUNG|nr:hypothetical protein BB560_005311 [Smittium megazygosporum]